MYFAVAALMAAVLVALGGGKAFATTLDSENGDAEHNAGITWTIDDEGVLTVTFPSSYSAEGDKDLYTGDSELVIPGTMDGKKVTQIKGSPGRGSRKIATVVLPGTMESWPTPVNNVVYFLYNLEEIKFDSEPTCDVAFPSAEGSSRVFPASLKKFNSDGVYDCVIPDSWTDLRGGLFKGTQISSVYIPETVQSCREYVFQDLTTLTKVVNDSDTWIPLPGCVNVADLQINGNVTEISNSAFEGFDKLESFTVTDNVESIGDSAFADCVNLKSVELGEGLTSIGRNAFEGCSNLSSVIFNGEELLTIEQNAFNGTSLTTLDLPDSVTYIGAGAFAGTNIEAIKMPSNLYMGYDMSHFSEEPGHWGDFTVGVLVQLFTSSLEDTNDTLKSVDLSSYQQTYIPSGMFQGCTGLTEIAIPKSVNTLMGSSFEDCTNLKDVYFYGDPANMDIHTSEKIVHPLGYSYITAGAFGEKDGGVDSETGSPTYKPVEGITFYGLGIMDNNQIKAYADESGCFFVPYAFLGSSETAVVNFGYEPPANEVSVASFVAGGQPSLVVNYAGGDITRTLVPGDDCTVVYTDADGNEVTSFDKAGTYTATITGDEKSVFGSTTVQFAVAAAPTVSVPVADASGTGVTAEGSLVVPDGSEVVLDVDPITQGETYDALMANLGSDTLAGVYEVTLLVDGEEIHEGFGSITLTFPIDPQWNNHYVTVYHRHDDGTITSERVTASEGKVVVTVTDLSTFMLAVGEAVPQQVVPGGNGGYGDQNQQTTVQVSMPGNAGANGSQLAQTGDQTPVVPLVALACVASLAVGAAAIARRKALSRR